MFISLPNSAPSGCSRSPTPQQQQQQQQPPPRTPGSRSKPHRHTSLLNLLRSKKQDRTSLDTTTPILFPIPSLPPSYTSLYPNNQTQRTSPSLHAPTRSRSRNPSHIRPPSKPWAPAPNAPNRGRAFTPSSSSSSPSSSKEEEEEEEVDEASNTYSPVRMYSTYHPSNSSQVDDPSIFSPFGSAPSSSGFYSKRAAEGDKGRGRRSSTGCAWEKIGERRARREGARSW